jgi:hypothetical protein
VSIQSTRPRRPAAGDAVDAVVDEPGVSPMSIVRPSSSSPHDVPSVSIQAASTKARTEIEPGCMAMLRVR